MNMRSGFVTSDDGLAIYWRSTGIGPPIVCCNGAGVSTGWWRNFVDTFADRHQLVLWDYPGHGLSERPRDPTRADLSIDRMARDLQAVIQASGAERPVLAGHSMGCQVIFEHRHQYPDGSRALIPMQGTAGSVLATFMNTPGTSTMMRRTRKLVRGTARVSRWLPHLAFRGPLPRRVAHRLSLVDRHYISRVDFHSYLKHLGDIDWHVFVETAVAADEHDAWDSLPGILAPVLVVAAEHDLFTPLHLSRRMSRILPNAELVVLIGGSHAAPLEQPQRITARVDQFLRQRAYPELDLPPIAAAPGPRSARG